jgi:NADH-ubiquinone oxidoreductase chain 1
MFLIYILLLILPIVISVAFYTLAERKIIASIQRRTGPNVVGF